MTLVRFFEKYEAGCVFRSVQVESLLTHPAWSAGIQTDMDVSGTHPENLDASYPCRHDKIFIFMLCG
jgi:hypothetical protein